jgi:UPF0042 nucleotide-binding protein
MSVLEDIGFYCVDNMPPQLLSKFAEICQNSSRNFGENFKKAAIATDIRAGDLLGEILENVEILRSTGAKLEILYLEAADEVLFRRYKETRRKHPLDFKFAGDLAGAIKYERQKLTQLRDVADYCVDTSYLRSGDLREKISDLFLEKASDSMSIQVMSFGFKHGFAAEGDLVFDVRCLPNPFYVQELKHKTGLDREVSEYVLKFKQATDLLVKLKDLTDFLIPLYIHEGKSRLVIAFGCTGGKHRSVTFAEETAKYLTSQGYKVNTVHRDIANHAFLHKN